MERILQARYPQKKITVINTGICGSDPIFGFKIYDSLMYKFSPDVVIQSFAKQDFFEDIAFRGGFERFSADGILSSPEPFKYEHLFKLSFLSRIYFTGLCGYNMFFLNKNILIQKTAYFKNVACMLAHKWDEKIKKDKFKMYFVSRPDPGEIIQKKYDPSYQGIYQSLKDCSALAKVVDLLPFYNDSIKMQDNIHKYFWEKDGHHSARGYYEMARGTADAIEL